MRNLFHTGILTTFRYLRLFLSKGRNLLCLLKLSVELQSIGCRVFRCPPALTENLFRIGIFCFIGPAVRRPAVLRAGKAHQLLP